MNGEQTDPGTRTKKQKVLDALKWLGEMSALVGSWAGAWIAAHPRVGLTAFAVWTILMVWLGLKVST
jgi:hypothetical protein